MAGTHCRQSPTTFPKFPELPIELRIRIFECFFDQFRGRRKLISWRRYECATGRMVIPGNDPDIRRYTMRTAREAGMALYPRFAFEFLIELHKSYITIVSPNLSRQTLSQMRHLVFTDVPSVCGLVQELNPWSENLSHESLCRIFPVLESITFEDATLADLPYSYVLSILKAFKYVSVVRVVQLWSDTMSDLNKASQRIRSLKWLVLSYVNPWECCLFFPGQLDSRRDSANGLR